MSPLMAGFSSSWTGLDWTGGREGGKRGICGVGSGFTVCLWPGRGGDGMGGTERYGVDC